MNPRDEAYTPQRLRVGHYDGSLFYLWSDLVGKSKRGPSEIIRRMSVKPSRTDVISAKIGRENKRLEWVSRRVVASFVFSKACPFQGYATESITAMTFDDVMASVYNLVTVENLSDTIHTIYKGISYDDNESTTIQPQVTRQVVGKRKLNTNGHEQLRKRIRDDFDTANQIEEFLNSETFDSCKESIDIYAYFHLVNKEGTTSEACKCTTLGHEYRNYRTAPPTTRSLAKERTRQFLCGFNKVCQLANQDFIWILNNWFKERPSDFMSFVKSFIECDGRNLKLLSEQITSTRKSAKFICGVPKADFLSYVRCKCHISYSALQEFRLWTFSDDIIPNECVLMEETNKWNADTARIFGIRSMQRGIVAEPKEILTHIIKSHLKEQTERRKLEMPVSPPTNHVKIKLCMDGRTICGTHSVSFSMIPLNLTTFAPQSRNSVFPITEWLGKESDAQQYLVALKEFALEIEQNGIKIDDQCYVIKIFWVSDLCSLQYVSNVRANGLFCPFCTCKNTPDAIFSPNKSSERSGDRALRHFLKIPHSRVIVCLLHMTQRISEFLLIRSSSGVFQPEIERKLQRLENFRSFTFDEDDDDRESVLKPHIYLSGRQCKTLLQHYRSIFEGVSWRDGNTVVHMDSAVIDIWKKWKHIVKLLNNDDEYYSTHEDCLPELQNCIDEFMTAIVRKWSHSKKTSYYLHILQHHVVDMVGAHGALSSFANEGFESSHGLDSFIDERMTASSTSRSNDEPENFYNQTLGMRTGLSDDAWKEWQLKFQVLQRFLIHHRLLYQSVMIEGATWNRIPRRCSKQQIDKYSQHINEVAIIDDWDDSEDENYEDETVDSHDMDDEDESLLTCVENIHVERVDRSDDFHRGGLLTGIHEMERDFEDVPRI